MAQESALGDYSMGAGVSENELENDFKNLEEIAHEIAGPPSRSRSRPQAALLRARLQGKRLVGDATPTSGLECTQKVVLDGFLPLDYRLRPNHYKPMVNFMSALDALRQAGRTIKLIVIEGYSDLIGNQSVEIGVALDRALEVNRHLAWLAGIAFEFDLTKTRLEPVPMGAIAPRGNAALNRRVELKGFCEK